MADIASNDMTILFKNNIEKKLFEKFFINGENFLFDRIIPFFFKRNIIYYITFLLLLSILRFDFNIFKLFFKELKNIKSNIELINNNNKLPIALPRVKWWCALSGKIFNISKFNKWMLIRFNSSCNPPSGILKKLSDVFNFNCYTYWLDLFAITSKEKWYDFCCNAYGTYNFIVWINSLWVYYNFGWWETLDKYYNSVQKEELIDLLLTTSKNQFDKAYEQLFYWGYFSKKELNRIKKKRLCNLLNEKE